MRSDIIVISGTSNRPLADAAARYAGTRLKNCEIMRHNDGEVNINIQDNMRGGDVFVIQSTSAPGAENLMELLIIMDALKRSSADRVTAVLPYFGYARQDRKNSPRQPITAKLVADLITTAGANRILTIDLHAAQIMGFFNQPVDNLFARPIFLPYLNNYIKASGKLGEQVCIVSPDSGGVSRARAYAKRLDGSLAIIDKRRPAPGVVAEMNVVGDVRDKLCIIVDDMVDSGGTLIKAADALLENGASEVMACCTHAVLSGNAAEKLSKSNISKMVVSDTIDHSGLAEENSRWLVQLSVAQLLGESMRRIHDETSVSELFDE